MANGQELVVGELARSLDERHRISIPQELLAPLAPADATCILAKERPGCLSLWDAGKWHGRLDSRMNLFKDKILADTLKDKIDEVQLLGRLLSTRHRTVKITGRGRLLVPEGFREFLGVEPGDEVLVVGAAICIELWRPDAWLAYLEKRIPRFNRLFNKLSG